MDSYIYLLLFIYLFIYLYIYLSIYLSIYLLIYLKISRLSFISVGLQSDEASSLIYISISPYNSIIVFIFSKDSINSSSNSLDLYL